MTADDEQLAQQWYDQKSALMERVLGKEHDIVMHAIIPYAIGGGLDLYYYPNRLPGTAIATKELCETPGEGPSNSVFDAYELVMFTKYSLVLDDVDDESTPFGQSHQTINSVLNLIARYSAQATLNPHETCEFPKDMEKVGGKCFIFDRYGEPTSSSGFGLLAVIEIFRTEMKFARKRGGAKLIAELKHAGCYPYSDMDRKPVV